MRYGRGYPIPRSLMTDPWKSIGYMPDDWKPRVSIIRSQTQGGARTPSMRRVYLKIGGKHISLPDGTRIEPMQAEVPVDDLRSLRRSLDEAIEWLANGEASREVVDEVD